MVSTSRARPCKRERAGRMSPRLRCRQTDRRGRSQEKLDKIARLNSNPSQVEAQLGEGVGLLENGVGMHPA